MKTNQIMLRQMGDLTIQQRTKDGMFNATDLLKIWNEKHPNEKRELDNFWKSTNLTELMSEIAENELGFTSVDFTELKNALSSTSKARADRGGGTWMNPILFLKFAMYLSPRFEYHVLRFVSDQMIKFRNDAGDAYKELSSAIQTIVPKALMPSAMQKVGEAINWVVFNNHEKMIRNKKGEEAALRELYELERKVAANINDGFICSFESLIAYLRRKYSEKYYPNVFLTK